MGERGEQKLDKTPGQHPSGLRLSCAPAPANCSAELRDTAPDHSHLRQAASRLSLPG